MKPDSEESTETPTPTALSSWPQPTGTHWSAMGRPEAEDCAGVLPGMETEGLKELPVHWPTGI